LGGPPSRERKQMQPWSEEEDQLLSQLVDQHGTSWAHIARLLPVPRTGKQCRERWNNQLAPQVCKKPWTKEEDEAIIAAQAEVGNKWTEVARRLDGRSENAVKNRWHSNLCRRLRTTEKNTVLSLPPPADLGVVPVIAPKDATNAFEWLTGVHDDEGGVLRKPKRAVPQPWTESEHLRFLLGLERFGKGDWRAISRYCVPSRTPIQIASHAQKYFRRKAKDSRERELRATDRRSENGDSVADRLSMMEPFADETMAELGAQSASGDPLFSAVLGTQQYHHSEHLLDHSHQGFSFPRAEPTEGQLLSHGIPGSFGDGPPAGFRVHVGHSASREQMMGQMMGQMELGQGQMGQGQMGQDSFLYRPTMFGGNTGAAMQGSLLPPLSSVLPDVRGMTNPSALPFPFPTSAPLNPASLIRPLHFGTR